jgi:hypothetical protein
MDDISPLHKVYVIWQACSRSGSLQSNTTEQTGRCKVASTIETSLLRYALVKKRKRYHGRQSTLI